jgi:hypothetical protein
MIPIFILTAEEKVFKIVVGDNYFVYSKTSVRFKATNETSAQGYNLPTTNKSLKECLEYAIKSVESTPEPLPTLIAFKYALMSKWAAL